MKKLNAFAETMKDHVCTIAFSLICMFAVFGAHAQTADKKNVLLKVVIIRHGEKPDNGDNLSCAGLNRALALPAVLDTVVGKPDYTYVPTIGTGDKKTTSVRMFQTVTPFAVQQNLTINSKYNETDTTGAAKDVLKKRGVVLMVWEHTNIPGLARNLKVKGNLSWSGKDFDSIWIIEYTKLDSKGNLKSPTLTIEQENITPTNTCPGQ